jgi:hypothetical protein
LSERAEGWRAPMIADDSDCEASCSVEVREQQLTSRWSVRACFEREPHNHRAQYAR